MFVAETNSQPSRIPMFPASMGAGSTQTIPFCNALYYAGSYYAPSTYYGSYASPYHTYASPYSYAYASPYYGSAYGSAYRGWGGGYYW